MAGSRIGAAGNRPRGVQGTRPMPLFFSHPRLVSKVVGERYDMSIVGIEICSERLKVICFVAPDRSIVRLCAEDQDRNFAGFYGGNRECDLLRTRVSPGIRGDRRRRVQFQRDIDGG